ncbi:MAG: glycosyltransferase 87 family protein, partial [Candidatus Dormibacteria bacterium]
QPAGIGPLHNPADFVSFYCGAKAQLAGADPYLNEPLRSCEHAGFAASGVPMVRNLVVPAPLPAFALAFFTPFALLPFRIAASLWFLLSVGATVASGIVLGRNSGIRAGRLAVVLLGAVLYPSLAFGQVMPLVVLLLVLCGAALRAERPRLAALLAAAMALEPHAGLAAILALALWVPRARAPLAAVLGGLAALTLAFGGPARALEYLTRVLPAQARGEGLDFNAQYGLSALVHVFGAAPSLALLIGTLSYLAMLALGLGLAPRFARALEEPAALVYAPVAFAMLGGVYVHAYTLAAVLPLALAVVMRTRDTGRFALAVAAFVALVVPWEALSEQSGLIRALPARAAYVEPAPLLARVAAPHELAERTWAAWLGSMNDRDHRSALELLATKLPTWFGLATILALAGAPLAEARRPVLAEFRPRQWNGSKEAAERGGRR